MTAPSPETTARPRRRWSRALRPGPGLRSTLALRDFRLLVVGQVLSTLGDQFYLVAIPFLIIRSGGSGRDLGVILGLYGVARIVSLGFGGVLGDRVGRVRIMLYSDYARLVLVGALAFASLFSHLSLVAIAALSVPIALFEGTFLPSSYAIMPELVESDALPSANALASTAANLSFLFGPLLGGVVVGVGSPAIALVVDAASFAVSAGTLTAIDRRRLHGNAVSATEAAEPAAEGGEARGGAWRGLLRNRLFAFSLLNTVAVNLAYLGLTEVALPLFAKNSIHKGAGGYGLLLALFGAGSLAGTITSGILPRLPHRGKAALTLGMLFGAAFALLPVGNQLVVAAACLLFAGAAQGWLNVFYVSILQQRLPQARLARAMSMLMLAAYGTHPVSVAAAGGLTDAFGVHVVFMLGGAVVVGAFAIGFLGREYRNI